MAPADTAGYINHQSKIAGHSDVVLADDAITLIHNASRGRLRAVNNLALPALNDAFVTRHRPSGRPHASPSAKQQPIEANSLHHDDHRVTAAQTPSPSPPRSTHCTEWGRSNWPSIARLKDADITKINDAQHPDNTPMAIFAHCHNRFGKRCWYRRPTRDGQEFLRLILELHSVRKRGIG